MPLSSDVSPALEKKVGQYIQLRDMIKEIEEKHKTELKLYKETLEQLNGSLLQDMNTIGGDSVRTGAGTVYRTAKKSASIADMAAFWTYVVATANFDLLDKRANVKAVEDHIESNKTPPPGVNFNSTFVVGVRRA